MKSMNNRVQLIGRLGADPELKTFGNDSKMARINVATSERIKDKDGNYADQTQWHNVIAWGKLADLVNDYLKKGSELCLEGKLNNRSYEDKEGKKQYVTEIVMHEMKMLRAPKV